MAQGRHGSGYAIVGDYVYAASGSLNRGGGPELDTIERLKLPKPNKAIAAVEPQDSMTIVKQWHTHTIDVLGPQTSESNQDNPFLNYRLLVTFTQDDTTRTVRGYYAADGNAAQSGADAGATWQVKFKPPKTGEWQYEARLEQGEGIALQKKTQSGKLVTIKTGEFRVIDSDREAPDFRALGYMTVENSHFYFPEKKRYWLKGGHQQPRKLARLRRH